MPKSVKQTQPSFAEIKRFDSEEEIDRGIEKLTRCQTLFSEFWDCQAAYDDRFEHAGVTEYCWVLVVQTLFSEFWDCQAAYDDVLSMLAKRLDTAGRP